MSRYVALVGPEPVQAVLKLVAMLLLLPSKHMNYREYHHLFIAIRTLHAC